MTFLISMLGTMAGIISLIFLFLWSAGIALEFRRAESPITVADIIIIFNPFAAPWRVVSVLKWTMENDSSGQVSIDPEVARRLQDHERHMTRISATLSGLHHDVEETKITVRSLIADKKPDPKEESVNLFQE